MYKKGLGCTCIDGFYNSSRSSIVCIDSFFLGYDDMDGGNTTLDTTCVECKACLICPGNGERHRIAPKYMPPPDVAARMVEENKTLSEVAGPIMLFRCPMKAAACPGEAHQWNLSLATRASAAVQQVTVAEQTVETTLLSEGAAREYSCGTHACGAQDNLYRGSVAAALGVHIANVSATYSELARASAAAGR